MSKRHTTEPDSRPDGAVITPADYSGRRMTRSRSREIAAAQKTSVEKVLHDQLLPGTPITLYRSGGWRHDENSNDEMESYTTPNVVPPPRRERSASISRNVGAKRRAASKAGPNKSGGSSGGGAAGGEARARSRGRTGRPSKTPNKSNNRGRKSVSRSVSRNLGGGGYSASSKRSKRNHREEDFDRVGPPSSTTYDRSSRSSSESSVSVSALDTNDPTHWQLPTRLISARVIDEEGFKKMLEEDRKKLAEIDVRTLSLKEQFERIKAALDRQ